MGLQPGRNPFQETLQIFFQSLQSPFQIFFGCIGANFGFNLAGLFFDVIRSQNSRDSLQRVGFALGNLKVPIGKIPADHRDGIGLIGQEFFQQVFEKLEVAGGMLRGGHGYQE